MSKDDLGVNEGGGSDPPRDVAALSHELRTPLQRIRFALEAARTSSDQEARLTALRRADAAVEEMERRIEDLLSAVKLEEYGGQDLRAKKRLASR